MGDRWRVDSYGAMAKGGAGPTGQRECRCIAVAGASVCRLEAIARRCSDQRWANVRPIDPVKWPILYATFEHRAGVAEIEQFLKGNRLAAPRIDYHLCRSGSWLDVEPSAGRSGRTGFQATNALHQQLHAYANGILDLKSDSEAAARSRRWFAGKASTFCAYGIGRSFGQGPSRRAKELIPDPEARETDRRL